MPDSPLTCGYSGYESARKSTVSARLGSYAVRIAVEMSAREPGCVLRRSRWWVERARARGARKRTRRSWSPGHVSPRRRAPAREARPTRSRDHVRPARRPRRPAPLPFPSGCRSASPGRGCLGDSEAEPRMGRPGGASCGQRRGRGFDRRRRVRAPVIRTAPCLMERRAVLWPACGVSTGDGPPG